ncbi:MAG: hypothetical protein JJE49_11015 [Peptostreptococcaceae bacterium]|nr:hypothetical protein [Peptostreptococcaceae bacterium]
MKEKRSKNILKDAIWDYYLTNREITKEYDKEYKDKKPGKFNKREKIYVVAIVIGLLLLLLKYFVF